MAPNTKGYNLNKKGTVFVDIQLYSFSATVADHCYIFLYLLNNPVTIYIAPNTMLALKHLIQSLLVLTCCLKGCGAAHVSWNKSVRNTSTIDCNKTLWLHLPKTSSMFCVGIQHVCCPAQFEKLTEGITINMLEEAFDPEAPKTDDPPYVFNLTKRGGTCFHFHRRGYQSLDCPFEGMQNHDVLHKDVDLHDTMALTFIREPKSRVISAFLHGVHCQGIESKICDEIRKINRASKSMSTSRKSNGMTRQEKLLKAANMYVSYPGMLGQQVKWLIGDSRLALYPGDPKHVEEMVAKALARLKQFFFVGLFEQYSRSFHLFHALANVGKLASLAVEFFLIYIYIF
jgi:hypothetical protein